MRVKMNDRAHPYDLEEGVIKSTGTRKGSWGKEERKKGGEGGKEEGREERKKGREGRRRNEGRGEVKK
jgi:hypothetical protein